MREIKCKRDGGFRKKCLFLGSPIIPFCSKNVFVGNKINQFQQDIAKNQYIDSIRWKIVYILIFLAIRIGFFVKFLQKYIQKSV